MDMWRGGCAGLCWVWVCCSWGCVQRTVIRPDGGHALGKHRLTLYWIPRQRKFRPQVALFAGNRRVAWVSSRFSRRLRMQGTGRLLNGLLVQYAGRCRPAHRTCMLVRVINRRRYPHGVGAMGIALRPFRSVAVGRGHIRLGTRLYIPALRRLLRRSGMRHRGCFRAHDRTGRKYRRSIDLFVGNQRLFRRYVKGRLPRYVRVYVAHPRCRRKRRKMAHVELTLP
ncbi:MAG: hypothetical protein AAGJ35_05800 [Myxococcota bacterium]